MEICLKPITCDNYGELFGELKLGNGLSHIVNPCELWPRLQIGAKSWMLAEGDIEPDWPD